jgi:hypothetical protein
VPKYLKSQGLHETSTSTLLSLSHRDFLGGPEEDLKILSPSNPELDPDKYFYALRLERRYREKVKDFVAKAIERNESVTPFATSNTPSVFLGGVFLLNLSC